MIGAKSSAHAEDVLSVICLALNRRMKMAHWSAISENKVLGKLLRLPLRLLPRELRVPILRGRLQGKWWIVGSGVHGYWLGSYEYEKRILFEKTITEGSVVFDIGAHVGYYTLLAAVLAGPRGKIFAFEPNPRNLKYLQEHVTMNHLTNIVIIEAAVADKAGSAFFDSGSHSCCGRLAAQGAIRVNTVALDDLVAAGELPVPNFMKIDVEGAEDLVLAGASSLIENHHPIIFLATHGADKHQQCCQWLRSRGYTLSAIDNQTLEDTREVLVYR
jgi:FkbM family methyltransferase